MCEAHFGKNQVAGLILFCIAPKVRSILNIPAVRPQLRDQLREGHAANASKSR
jgi:hypothetical protein